jgi:competence protein ComEA
MTSGRDAFLQLLGVLLASGLLRAGCAPRVPPEDALPGRGVDPAELVDSAAVLAAEEARRSRPLEPGEALDPNRAPEAELDRLPGVGPGLARAIVAARDTLPFDGVEDLARVRGIGGSTVEKLRPLLSVGTVPVRRSPARAPGAARPVGAPGGSRNPLESPSPRPSPTPAGADPVVDLNRATARELEALRGVGPVLAERIVETRRRLGGFRSVDQLLEVKGVGPAVLERLRERVRVGPGG